MPLDIFHDLGNIFVQRIASGLKRKSISKPSDWALHYRQMGGTFPGPWTFKWHPWLKEMHDTEAEHNCGQKCAQVGYSETMLNTVFYTMDVKGADCLYVLPNKSPDAKDFSASRFDPALELSPYLRKMFSDVKNVGHKRAGASNLYIRGSQSRSGLKSIPTALIILDERDEMNAKNIPLAMERAAGQREKKIWEISTPTVSGKGINTIFNRSTKEHFFFKCPSCSKLIELTFPACIEITADDPNDDSLNHSFYKCSSCQARLEHQSKPDWLADGIWVPSTKSAVRGFYINQMYSSTVTPGQFARKFLVAQFDPAAEQEFYNSNLGVAHEVKGAKVSDAMIDGCIEDYRCSPSYHKGGIVTMGVDVGSRLHVEIDEWEILRQCEPIDINMHARPRMIWYGTVPEFTDLQKLMDDFSVRGCVIDANPERRKSIEFVLTNRGRAKMCFYGRGVAGKNINVTKNVEEAITVDRTAWLDLTLSRYHRGKDGILLPKDIDLEYRTHVKSLVRKYERDENDNPTGKYLKSDTDQDHYAHARNYSEIALYYAAMNYTRHQTMTKKDMGKY